MPFFRGSSLPRDQSWVSSIADSLPLDLPGGSDDKESACNAGDPSSIPGSGRCPVEGKSNPLHYSCLENLMDRGTWVATVQGSHKIRHN